jgi:hypothetical protein
MHDCPRCKVPLHGHEEFCPACGEKQVVKAEYRNIHVPKTPPVNIVPFVIAFALVAVVIAVAASQTWIGQLLTHGTPKTDPIDSITPAQGRQMIETQVTSALTAIQAPVKISYTADGKPADKTSPQPLEMTIETKLQDPNQRKAVIDPIKQYMDKAHIPSLVMKDAKSRATWTYTCTLSPAPAADDAGTGAAPQPAADASQQPAAQ